MKIIAFAGSNSKNSINKKLVSYAANQFNNAEVELLDLNDYEMPIFGVDLEARTGPQEKAKEFLSKISEADLLVVSLAEHNGSYSVAFKNILDWASRIDGKVFQNKPMLLMATSQGGRGAISVLEAAKKRFPIHGAKILGTFSLPNFNDNFDLETGIINPAFRENFKKIVLEIESHLNEFEQTKNLFLRSQV